MYAKLWILSLALALPTMAEQSSSASGQAIDPLARGEIFNIVDWDGGSLPRRYERSAQLPMSLEDVGKLSASKFSDSAIIKMLEERRCVCDASVDALVTLKEAGVSEKVIQAVSLHSLPPNRSLGLTIAIDFEGLGGEAAVSTEARQGYLYLIVPDGGRERIFVGNLQAILAGNWQRDALIDNTDLLLPKKVRRVIFAAEVPLKTYGPKEALIFTSTKPDIYTAADIPEADRAGVQEFHFEYPTSSLERICNLQVLYRQDAILANRWHLERTHFQCEWD